MTKQAITKNTFVSNILRGFTILIPVLAGIYLFRNMYNMIAGKIQEILAKTTLTSTYQVIAVALLAVIVLILFAYLVGLVSKSDPVVAIANKLDQWLLENSKTYRGIKLKLDNSAQFILDNRPPVFVTFGEAERPGFLMEEAAEQPKCVVFIPKNFNSFDGHVFIVLKKNVRHAQADSGDFIYALEHLGAGMNIN